jgi:hypothetical protein
MGIFVNVSPCCPHSYSSGSKTPCLCFRSSPKSGNLFSSAWIRLTAISKSKTCEVCGGVFQVKAYRAKTARFCSFKCGGSWHAKKRLPTVVSAAMKGNKRREGLPPSNAFKPGSKAWNRGKKGIHLSPGSEFKKGCESNRKVPVGTVRIRPDKQGAMRAYVKTAEPRTWKARSVFVWESHFGPVPRGCVIHHGDFDSLNDDRDNLQCLTRSAHLKIHQAAKHLASAASPR